MKINREFLTGAVARGWCHKKNAHKEMDADLAFAIVTEIESALTSLPPPGKLVELDITEESLLDKIHQQARTMGDLLDRAIAAESKLNALGQDEEQPSGRFCVGGYSDPLDLISEYVEPRKAVEAWATIDREGCLYFRVMENEAKEIQALYGGTTHHLREVNPAREKAVDALVQLATRYAAVIDHAWGRDFSVALAALDAAEGVK